MNAEQSNPDKVRQTLRQRAQLLAKELVAEDCNGEKLEIVAFAIGRETYGIPSSLIREVCPVKEITAIPCVPAFIRGVIIVRGKILTLVDLRRFFNLQSNGISDLNKVLIIRSHGHEVGVLADSILGVQSLSPGCIQASLPAFSGIPLEYVRGFTPERLMILDIEKILSSESMLVNDVG